MRGSVAGYTEAGQANYVQRAPAHCRLSAESAGAARKRSIENGLIKESELALPRYG
jgi:hypothetical protein